MTRALVAAADAAQNQFRRVAGASLWERWFAGAGMKILSRRAGFGGLGYED
jgi:hypothetical protein